MNTRFVVLIVVTLLMIILLVAGGGYAWKKGSDYIAGQHMQGVTQTILEFGKSNSEITTDEEAIEAIEVMEYISRYYVVGEGYRGPGEIEVALERQREESMKLISEALEKHTGEEFGLDIARWEEWARAADRDVDK